MHQVRCPSRTRHGQPRLPCSSRACGARKRVHAKLVLPAASLAAPKTLKWRNSSAVRCRALPCTPARHNETACASAPCHGLRQVEVWHQRAGTQLRDDGQPVDSQGQVADAGCELTARRWNRSLISGGMHDALAQPVGRPWFEETPGPGHWESAATCMPSSGAPSRACTTG